MKGWNDMPHRNNQLKSPLNFQHQNFFFFLLIKKEKEALKKLWKKKSMQR